MSFPVSERDRVGQSTYWMYFGGFIVAAIILTVIAVVEVMKFNFVPAVICLLLMAPLGIYFRVIMMRRCRDIGWPAFLPWMFVGLSFMVGFMSGFGRAAGGAPSTALLILPMFIGLADFVFSIVIGCIPGKGANLPYDEIFGPDGYAPGPARPRASAGVMPNRGYLSGQAPVLARDDASQLVGDIDYDRFDAAVAQALAAKSNPGQAAAAPANNRGIAAHRPAGGFGRKGL